MTVVLVIPDTQIPFQHAQYLDFLKFVNDKHAPDRIIHIGDLVDFHAFSRWDKSSESKGGMEEIMDARKVLKKLVKLFPNVTITTGNHDERIARVAETMGIHSSLLKSLNEVLELPTTWKWVDKVVIDNVRYMHGTGYSGPHATKNMVIRNMQSTVHGHLHTGAQIVYIANDERLMFGMNVGCLINHKLFAFGYQRTNPQKPILTVGIVKDGIPILEPMILNKNGQWRGY